MDVLFGNRCGSKSKCGNFELSNAIEMHFMNESTLVSAIAESEKGISKQSCTGLFFHIRIPMPSALICIVKTKHSADDALSYSKSLQQPNIVA